MGLSALSIRIIAPIPGRDVIGIEVPNTQRETVVLRELLESSEFINSRSMLTLALGKDISGIPFYMDLRRAPHLMIAGTTGSGKSVFLHTVLASMLFKATPYELKFIMIDPKMLELSIYEDIPHLLHPVVTNPKEAAAALRWAVKEMELRYKLMSEVSVRDIESYNSYIAKSDSRGNDQNSLPYIVIIIDELADLMMIAPTEIRESITRLSQMARAAGIHLIVATQRPSVDIVAGLIKANFPARISFLVSSRVDSRIILDSTGAEQLLGKGDMLFLQPGTSKLLRIQGALISDEERESITEFLKSQAKPEYNQEITKIEESDTQPEIEEEKDELYFEALRIIAETRQASISMLQRKLKIGYNRAARIVEIMEKEGVIGQQESAGKPREVFIDIDQVKARQSN
jgi:S-DNA-T family DNA segregation ATPase FtsK/SpoIIIE